MSTETKLPVPVLEHPHWRVNFRPTVYERDRIGSLSDSLETVQKARVRLRGWDFPHISRRDEELEFGDQWIAGWSDFMGHLEYWRFYLSTQFLYLGSVREVTEPDWAKKLRKTMEWHAHARHDIESVPGFISIVNFTYTVTEIFEFAARLSQAGVYVDPVTINIRLNHVKGFMLAADENRAWSSDYATSQETLSYEVTLQPAEIVSSAAEQAMKAIIMFFERFGWLKPNIDVIRSDQQKLLARQV